MKHIVMIWVCGLPGGSGAAEACDKAAAGSRGAQQAMNDLADKDNTGKTWLYYDALGGAVAKRN